MNFSKNEFLIICLAITNIIQYGILENLYIFQISILLIFILNLFDNNNKLLFLNDQIINFSLITLPFLTLIFTYDFGAARFYNTLAFSIFFILTYSLAKNSSSLNLSNILFPLSIFTLVVNLLGIIQYGFSTFRFGGLFLNANQSGRFCYFMFISVFILFFASDYNIFKKYNLYTYIFLLITFSLTIASNSRTIIFVFLIHLILSLITVFINSSKDLRFRQFYINLSNLKINKLFLITFITILILSFLGLFDELYEKLIGNSYLMIRNDDYTNGRILLWNLGIDLIRQNIGGVNNNLILMNELNTIHNNYIYFAIKYGLFSSIIYHFIFIKIFIFSTKYISTSRNAFFLSSLTIQMLFYWLFETASIVLPVIFIIYSYGLLVKEINQKKLSIK